MKVKAVIGTAEVGSASATCRRGAPSAHPDFFEGLEHEHVCWDPKDGEL